jgi:hypothetical protein
MSAMNLKSLIITPTLILPHQEGGEKIEESPIKGEEKKIEESPIKGEEKKIEESPIKGEEILKT